MILHENAEKRCIVCLSSSTLNLNLFRLGVTVMFLKLYYGNIIGLKYIFHSVPRRIKVVFMGPSLLWYSALLAVLASVGRKLAPKTQDLNPE